MNDEAGEAKDEEAPGKGAGEREADGHLDPERVATDDDEEEESPLLRSDGGIRWRYLAWAAGSLAALGAFIWLLVAVQTVSVPFLIAFILAYLLDPAVDRFEERGISRTVGICVLFLVGLVVGSLALLLIGPQFVTEVSKIPEKLRLLAVEIVPWVETRFDVAVPRTIGDALTEFQSWIGGIEMAAITDPTIEVARALMGGTANVLSTVVAVLLIPVFAFFLLRDFDRIIEGGRALLPHRYRPAIVARFKEIDSAMSGFIRGQVTVAGILAVLYTAGLWMVGLPMAIVVGVVSGIGNMVPYLGTAVGLVLATLMAFLDWQGFGQLLLVYAVFAGVQALESWLLTPRIVGDSVGLSPFLVIIAVLLFGELFGFVGILIAVPLAAIVKILLRVLVEEYKASPFYRA